MNLSLLMAALTTGGCATAFQASRDYEFTCPWQEYRQVEVRARNGDVELRSAAVQAVSVSGTKYASGFTHADAEGALDRLEIYAGPAEDRPECLLIELRCPPDLLARNAGARVAVVIPDRCPATVRTGNGDVRLSAVGGPVVAETSNGAIEICDVSGDVDATSSNGRIAIETVTGTVRAETSNGRISAIGISGDCELHTSNGRIRYQAAPGTGGAVDLHTSNGSVHVTLPRSPSAQLDLRTTNGRVQVDLPDTPMRNVEAGRTFFRAQVGDGAKPVTVRTSNGSITVDAL